MKDKILEAVQISKTYGEGESAVHALFARFRRRTGRLASTAALICYCIDS